MNDQTDRNGTGRRAGQREIDSQAELPEAYEPLAEQVTRVFMEESPRLAPSVQAQQLAQLRARAAQKRSARRGSSRWSLGWLWQAAPRWAQVAAVAIIVVLLANGITVASASSLPGSLLYPVKRLAEQSNIILSPTSAERARVWMNLASIRLDEAQRVLSSGGRVEPTILDAVDQSILNALAEIAGTRGSERVDLLKQITELSVREQSVLDDFAPKALPTDRARLEQTSRLLGGVATLAGAAEANPSMPLLDTPSPAETPTRTSAVAPTGMPTDTPAPTLDPPDTPMPTPVPVQPAVEVRPTETEQVSQDPSGDNSQPKEKDTAEPQKAAGPEPEKSRTKSPDKQETPERDQSSPEPHKTESPKSRETRPVEH